MKFKKILFVSIFIFFSSFIYGAVTKSYCYEKENKIKGEKIYSLMRVASLTKLFTSYWALEKMGSDFRYETDFLFDEDSKSLYIKGGKDPYFLEHGLFYLLSELNKKKIFN